MIEQNYFICYGATAPSVPGPPQYRGFTITLGHTTFGRTPLDERSAPKDRPLRDNIQYSQQTDIHALEGTRTQQRAAADPHLRPRGYWYRRCKILALKISKLLLCINNICLLAQYRID